MKVSRTTIGAAMLATTALIASHGAWAQRAGGRLPPECRTPELRKCLTAGDNRRQCIAAAFQTLPDGCRKSVSERAAARAPLPEGAQELSFGTDPKQKVDLFRPAASTGKAPLLLFVHGGGWSIGDKRTGTSNKPGYYTGKGWAFGSTNYRLVPQATVEQQAADVAAAIALLRRQPGIDADRVVLMGHSAGAHLAALVATDPTYLKAAGVPLSAIRGVVLLDGAGYDIAAQMSQPRNPVATMYQQAFSSDPARQAALSPTSHAAAPNAANWLILPVARRADSVRQSQQLAAALRAAGNRAEVAPQPDKNHGSLNREMGEPGDPSTAVVDAFLKQL
ncbi:alpha/beta hydrolase [Sphingomonas sp. LHG3406-1]|uniref:alpha/beta hydrolase n=1 Tax=Sphingomonas sp. LHG3406-1 TaxID=2804617 RepID=UPI0026117A66|nr:alpha/beta hydrolase [Sphingomonas sp. LHG3406-1]